MAPLTVYIGTSGPATYSRTPPTVHPDDEVTFVLVGRTDAVVVTFTPSSPFSATTNSFGLDGASSSTASQGEEVMSSAPNGTYAFTAGPPSHPGPIKPDRPGTVSGDIEVTRDSGGPEEG